MDKKEKKSIGEILDALGDITVTVTMPADSRKNAAAIIGNLLPIGDKYLAGKKDADLMMNCMATLKDKLEAATTDSVVLSVGEAAALNTLAQALSVVGPPQNGNTTVH